MAKAPKKRTHLWDELDRYFQTLESSPLTDCSVRDYYYFAECFVRFMDGTFQPGAMVRNGTDRK